MKDTLKTQEVERDWADRPTGDEDSTPIIADDMPVIFEDEGQENMGETEIHTSSLRILHTGIETHLSSRPDYRVFCNMNWYYHSTERFAYLSPDVMIVQPKQPLPTLVRSYRTGESCPPPVFTLEVLSRRSFQQQDLTNKPRIYSDRGVAEYLLVDLTEEFLPERLLMKVRMDDGSWRNTQDADGGVTSALGFRIIVEADGKPRVLDAVTGKGYIRPEEADELVRQEQERAREAEARLRAAEEEIARLRLPNKKKKNS